MKIHITKKDIIWNYVGIIVSLCANFVMIPFLISFLDDDLYGLWNVFISLGSISVLFDFGFNSMFSRNVAYCWSGVKELKRENVEYAIDSAEVNYVLFNKVIKTCKMVYGMISIVALGFLMSIGMAYILFVSRHLSNKSEIVVAWTLYSIGVFFNLLYGYYDAFLRGVGQIGNVNKIRTFSKSIQIILTIVLLFCGFGILGTCISYVVYGLIFRYFSRKAFYNYECIGKKIDKIGKLKYRDLKDTLKIVWYNAWKEGIVSLSNFICNQITILICSTFLGLVETGKYSLAVQLTSAVAQISSSIFSSYQPTMQEAYAHRNNDYLRRVVSFSMRIYTLCYPLGILCIIIIVIPLLRFIKPSSSVSIIVLIEIAVYQFILKYRDCYAWYLGGTNRLIYYKSFLTSSILCIVLSLFCIKVVGLGIFGLVIAQISSQIIFNAWYWPLFVDKEINLNFTTKNRLFLEFLREKLKGKKI